MTPARWKRAGELFHQALERPAGERRPWLGELCAGDTEMLAEVESLLGSDADGAGKILADKIEPAFSALVRGNMPERAGPYRLVRELGRGGMGTVYLGERDDDEYQTKVAIKLVRRGMDTGIILNRFYRERQTLARLQHPHIARLLDGSTTADGEPYIVMEYIEGDRITDYCRAHELNTTRRLELFLDVCKAVDYAHRQFVVHRDLKPGNILVDRTGAVKLLDFGICKLLQAPAVSGDETMEFERAPLTPDYSSPEQIRGEATTIVSDVYSLAAVLYELLTGVKPHRITEYTLRGIERGICEEEIAKPSTVCEDRAVSRQLQGDLDTILLLALQKDPRRRYETIEQFAADVRRHLAHQPVKARPDTLAYRAGKFVRRRRGLVVSAALVVLSLLAGVLVSMRSARIANENLQLVRQLSNTFVFDVYDAVSDLPGSTRARQLVVQTGLKYLDNLSQNASGDEEFQVELGMAYRRIGDVQGNVMKANLGDTASAMASYGKAMRLFEAVLAKDPGQGKALGQMLSLHLAMGAVLEYTKNTKESIATYRKAVELAAAVMQANPEDRGIREHLASAHAALGRGWQRSGDLAAARQSYLQAKELFEPLAKAAPGNRILQGSLATVYGGIGMADARMGRMQEALAGHRKAAAIREQLVAANSANVDYQRELMFAYSHIGDVLGNPNLPNLGETARAVEAYEKMLVVARRVQEADPSDQRARGDYSIALSRVAQLLPEARSRERVELIRKSLTLQQEVAALDPQNVDIRTAMATNYNFLGDAYGSLREDENAAQAYRAGLKTVEPLLHIGSNLISTTCLLLYQKLGEVRVRQGAREEGLALARRALALSDSASPVTLRRPEATRKTFTARGLGAVGRVYARAARSAGSQPGDAAEARRWLTASLAEYRRLENSPVFNNAHRRDVNEVAKILEGVR
jgi:tetratricopeptide (TPR) repeat protein/tRNA A-37 threonylcarbamoyl transferase component Bud32